ncbi:hypothetical protein V2J23_17400 [Geobacillus thermoleovorans]|jgi:hypothetical protein|uniref:hypothetical protein n=1 Tax=Anoxybacillaceae TaxID=3120669 RepID=UPI0002AF405C|nr:MULTISPECIES: hypothetical protein [Bacillaceae]OQO98511.1 hypothetical protein BSK33_17105 [Geobacillus sp. 44B]AGE21477.1 hypothetical protein GHH_c09380 [Geobacillus sp. GHH01]QNU39029.1 hypothetical protein IC801_07455 [Geobacillus sp. 44B]BDG37467.1 hypothetical protein PcaKH15_33730 [Parageobacillus caldoxylosilyticus]BDG41258.1 hypothetical protein PcaKH16_33970 [Parageobacillus caldoxylosilyticus]
MNLEEFFINNKNDYIEMKETLSNIFILNQSMPNQVFHREYNGFLFGEYHGMYEEEFWKGLQILAQKSGDKYILLAELENYYNERMERYEWAKIPVDLSYENYLDILNAEPFENIYIGLVDYSCKLVFTSPSLQWGGWGERDQELYVFACKENFKSKFKESPLTDAFQLNEALDYIYAIYHDKEAAKSFCEKLLENYKN